MQFFHKDPLFFNKDAFTLVLENFGWLSG